MVSREELRAQYDREMRQDPVPDAGSYVEQLGPIVRVVGKESYVIFSDLNEANATGVVAEQVEFFRRSSGDAEWKVFGHDRPPHLEAILAAAGFVPDEPETLVVFDLRDGVPGGPAGAGVEVRRVRDRAGLHDAARASEGAFGPDDRPYLDRWIGRLGDPTLAMFVAYSDGTPAATGRVELTPGRSFAGLWGGGTVPAYRHRGIYRALVAARATLARESGYRFLTVDARDTSRPSLERLGFVPITTTRPWKLGPGPEVPRARAVGEP